MRKSLQDKLVFFLFENKGWVSKGEITRKIWRSDKGTTFLPETVGRSLRSAEENHRIAVKYEGKNTLYKWLPFERRESYIPTSQRIGGALFKTK